VGTLVKKEFLFGSKSFFVVFAVVVPIAVTLSFSLIFGTFFSGKPRLGICDQGSSRVTEMVRGLDSLTTKKYRTMEKLKLDVETGAVDMGIILPPGFDGSAVKGETVTVTAYIWGESLMKDRVVIGTTMAAVIREMIGKEAPFEIASVTLGNDEKISWEKRLLPLIVLMALFMGGFLIPSSSLVNEKQKGTIKALAVSPVTMGTVYFSKGLVGFIVSLVMGVLILILNGAFSGPVLLLPVVLILGAVMAAEFGILLGAFVSSIDMLFTMIKSLNLLLYGPGIVYMFPAIPGWVGKVFPTYYVINPVIEITQHGAGWSDVFGMLCVLLALNVILFFGVLSAAKREKAAAG
jgi:ABC-2 type transport system permease protein